MSRKTKRRTARARVRPAAGQAQTSGGVAIAPVRQPQARVGGDQALVRSVEMSLGGRQPVRRGGRLIADNVDPSIPIDRVPFFQQDLIRLGIVAGIMVVVLIVAALIVIPLVVK